MSFRKFFSPVLMFGALAFADASFAVNLEAASVHSTSNATFEDDKEFVQVGFDLWEIEIQNSSPQTVQEHIDRARELVAQYRAGDLSFGDFKHSPRGLELLFHVFDATDRVFLAAQKKTSELPEFLEILEAQLIGLRWAIQSGVSHDQLAQAFDAAVLQAVQRIESVPQSGGTALELRFVYTFKYAWEDRIMREEAANPPSSSTAYVTLAQRVLKSLQDEVQGGTPSQRSYEVAVFVVEQIIEIMKAASHCNRALPDFIEMTGKHLTRINQAFDQALAQERSLKMVRERVAAEAAVALGELSGCSR